MKDLNIKLGIYWDLRYTFPSRHTGVGKHVIHVVRALSSHDSFHCVVLIAKDQEKLWEEQKSAHGLEDLSYYVLSRSERYLRWASLIGFKGTQLFDLEIDALYSPMELLPPIRNKPSFTTVHGAPAFERALPRKIRNSLIYRMDRWRQRLFFAQAKALNLEIFAVSQYLSRQIQETFSIAEKKITLSGNGVEDMFFGLSKRNAQVSDAKVLLCVGGINAFDGAPHLVQFAEYLFRHDPSWRIKIIGDRHESPWFEQMKAMQNVEWLGFLSSSEVLDQMERAFALLYFPLVESFGIIGVEAFAAGLPVLAGRSTGLPEVLGEAPIWVDPNQPIEIFDALKRLENSEEFRSQKISAAQTKSEDYRWERVAEKVASSILSFLK